MRLLMAIYDLNKLLSAELQWAPYITSLLRRPKAHIIIITQLRF